MNRYPAFLLLAALLGFAPGCGRSTPVPESLTLATTTSTRDSGLLDLLLPRFRERTGIEVKVVAVGSGQALQLGRRGDADAILSHAPDAERQFMAEGHGAGRRPVMHNEFVLVGPPDDPAGVKDADTIAAAFARIADRKSPFVSRGDDSGTHQKEREVWHAAGIAPAGEWYLRAGSGMAQTLRTADQLRAYTLSDAGTYLAERPRLDLAVDSRGDPLLRNPYHVIVVSPAAHPGVRSRSAEQFADFLTSPEARDLIASFGVDRFGEPLFRPDGPEE